MSTVYGPPWIRWLGAFLAACGCALAGVRYGLGFSPDALETRVFALASTYFEPKTFTVITTNLTDELALLLTLAGLSLVAFSKERVEDDALEALRAQSWVLATQLNLALVAVSAFTFFGLAFVSVLVANLGSTLLLYLLVFHARRLRRTHATHAEPSP